MGLCYACYIIPSGSSASNTSFGITGMDASCGTPSGATCGRTCGNTNGCCECGCSCSSIEFSCMVKLSCVSGIIFITTLSEVFSALSLFGLNDITGGCSLSPSQMQVLMLRV